MSGMGHTESQSARMLTPHETAELLRITPRHAARLARAGRLRRVILGARTVRYTAQSVEALINESGPEAATPDPMKNADAGGGRGPA
jgi:hypothetical protein